MKGCCRVKRKLEVDEPLPNIIIKECKQFKKFKLLQPGSQGAYDVYVEDSMAPACDISRLPVYDVEEVEFFSNEQDEEADEEADDDEDSNAEDYYANEYPDEED